MHKLSINIFNTMLPKFDIQNSNPALCLVWNCTSFFFPDKGSREYIYGCISCHPKRWKSLQIVTFVSWKHKAVKTPLFLCCASGFYFLEDGSRKSQLGSGRATEAARSAFLPGELSTQSFASDAKLVARPVWRRSSPACFGSSLPSRAGTLMNSKKAGRIYKGLLRAVFNKLIPV